MLLGEFSAECELDSIQLDVKSKAVLTVCMLLYQRKSWIYLLKAFTFL
jgi:hypothetical protein